MCLGAIYWARPKVVYYANTRNDAADIGFDDSFIYEEISADIEHRKIPLVRLPQQAAKDVFDVWNNKQDKTAY